MLEGNQEAIPEAIESLFNGYMSLLNNTVETYCAVCESNARKSDNAAENSANEEWSDHFQRLIFPYISKEILVETLEIARQRIERDPILLKMELPFVVVGDLHGNILELIRILKFCGAPPRSKFLFLGDIVDRGQFSVETIIFIFLLKIKFPNHVFLLRGNHEFYDVCKCSSFACEIISYFGENLVPSFIEVFNMIPIAAYIPDFAFFVHGGIGPSLKSIKQIEELKRPIKSFQFYEVQVNNEDTDCEEDSILMSQLRTRYMNSYYYINNTSKNAPLHNVPMKSNCISGESNNPIPLIQQVVHTSSTKTVNNLISVNNIKIVAEIVWSDPTSEISTFSASPRGIGYNFGSLALSNFLKENHFKILIRGHQPVFEGVCQMLNDQVITLYSSSNERGTQNKSAIGFITTDNHLEFHVFSPLPIVKRSDAKFSYLDTTGKLIQKKLLDISNGGQPLKKILSPFVQSKLINIIDGSNNKDLRMRKATRIILRRPNISQSELFSRRQSAPL